VQPQTTPEIEPRPGLALLLDILIAPKRAYATIAATRQWWPAALIVAICIFTSSFLTLPAQLSVEAISKHIVPRMTGATIGIVAFSAAVLFMWQVFGWSIVGSLYTNFCAAGRPTFRQMYRTFFALAANAAIPMALGGLVQGIVIRAHDPSDFHSWNQLANTLPLSLSVFAASNNPREALFLSSFDLPTMWSVLLTAYGGRAIGGIKLVPALIVPCAIVLLWALIQLQAGF
jgi:hypothetical protein